MAMTTDTTHAHVRCEDMARCDVCGVTLIWDGQGPMPTEGEVLCNGCKQQRNLPPLPPIVIVY